MKDRIIQFLKEMNLTSTKFADQIGVQRSSISHLLSGRNKPSFDFIEKMLGAYPDLNAQWLITGKGNMFENQPSLFNKDNQKNEIDLTSRESNIQNSTDNNTEIPQSAEENGIKSKNTGEIIKNSSSIERVIVFYKNGSFKEYQPE
jgi:transcriptional regulator with XRE-family HTH domain